MLPTPSSRKCFRRRLEKGHACRQDLLHRPECRATRDVKSPEPSRREPSPRVCSLKQLDARQMDGIHVSIWKLIDTCD